MSENFKIILWIIVGIVGAIALFSLIVVIACSVNGLTFAEQICEWFGGRVETIVDSAKETSEIVTNMPTIQG